MQRPGLRGGPSRQPAGDLAIRRRALDAVLRQRPDERRRLGQPGGGVLAPGRAAHQQRVQASPRGLARRLVGGGRCARLGLRGSRGPGRRRPGAARHRERDPGQGRRHQR